MHSETHPCTDICNVTQTHTHANAHPTNEGGKRASTWAHVHTCSLTPPPPHSFKCTPMEDEKTSDLMQQATSMVRAKTACQRPCERNHTNATANRSRNRCTVYAKLLTESYCTLQLVSAQLDLPLPHSSSAVWEVILSSPIIRLWLCIYVFVRRYKKRCTLLPTSLIFWQPIQSSSNLPFYETTCGTRGASCHCQGGDSRCWLITAAVENAAVLSLSAKTHFGRGVTCSASMCIRDRREWRRERCWLARSMGQLR